MSEAKALFERVLEPAQILTAEADLQRYGKDWLQEFSPNPSVVLLPKHTQEVRQIVKLCFEHSIALVPSGGRTGYSGGATATNGEVILSLERMNRICSIDPKDFSVTCESGVITEILQEKLSEHDLYFPLDLSSKGSSQIGGNIATNAGGIHVLKYGNTRDWITGLKVVTGTGELLEMGGGLIKNRTGYDLISLMTGSEGTLGIIVEATLRVTAKPKEKLRILCGLRENYKILDLLLHCRRDFPEISAFEYFARLPLELVMKHQGKREPFDTAYPAYIVVELESHSHFDMEYIESSFGEVLENKMVDDVIIGQSTQQSAEIMSYRELISETLSSHYTVHKNDISVRVGDAVRFLGELENLSKDQYKDSPAVVFGHIGDGNFHVTLLKSEGVSDYDFFQACKSKDRALFDLIRQFGGSVSAEHGVGLLKKDYLHYSRSREEIRIMKEIKKVFDPKGILNPGKIFDL